MIRLTIFIIALLLAIGVVGAEAPWLITLAVLAGIELLRGGPGLAFGGFRRWDGNAGMLRLALFVIGLVLATNTVEATDPWLITMAALAGIELFRAGPRLPFGSRRGWRRIERRWAREGWAFDDAW